MYHFLVSRKTDKGAIKIFPLPGQKFADGKEVNSETSCTAQPEIKSLCPLGTLFVTSTLKDKGGYYEAAPVSALLKEPPNERVLIADDAMWSAYEIFNSSMGATFEVFEAAKKESKKTSRTYLSSLLRKDELKPPTIEDNGFYVPEQLWYVFVRNIRKGIPTMLTGPTGTGKTELVMYACSKLGIELDTYDMGSMYDPVSGLLGVHRLNSAGVSEFDYSRFSKSIQMSSDTSGSCGVVLLDELSRAPVTTNNILFPCLDSRKELPIEMAGGEDVRNIKVSDQVAFVATANIGGEYTGTQTLDRALVDRFFNLELSYLPADIETKILVARTKVSEKQADMVANICGSIRNIYNRQEISTSVSLRHSLQACNLVKDGFDLDVALKITLLPLYEGTPTEGERATVNKLLMSK